MPDAILLPFPILGNHHPKSFIVSLLSFSYSFVSVCILKGLCMSVVVFNFIKMVLHFL